MADISIYRRIQRQGYFWLDMKKEAADLQQKCLTCQEHPREEKCAFIDEVEDWRQVYVDYLTKGVLLEEKRDASKVKRKAIRFRMFEGEVYRRCFNENPLRCLSQGEAPNLFFQMHQEEHQGGEKLYKQLLDHVRVDNIRTEIQFVPQILHVRVLSHLKLQNVSSIPFFEVYMLQCTLRDFIRSNVTRS